MDKLFIFFLSFFPGRGGGEYIVLVVHCPHTVIRYLGRSKDKKDRYFRCLAGLFAVRRLWRYWCRARGERVDRNSLAQVFFC